MGRADFCQRLEHVAGDHVAGLDCPALLQIQHHLGQAVVHAVQGGATDQVGVFAVGQHACRLVGLAARRQHPHRGAAGVIAGVGVGVDRDEQVGVVLARDLVALAQWNEIVAVAGQHGLHPRLTIDQRRQVARHRQRDILFQRAARAVCALVLAAVAGVDRHHYLALTVEQRRGLLGGGQAGMGAHPAMATQHRLDHGHGRTRGCIARLHRRGRRRHAVAGRIQIQHQAVIRVGRGRLEHETFQMAARSHTGKQLQPVGLAGMAHAAEQPLRGRVGEPVGDAAVAQIHHGLPGVLADRVIERAGQIEHHAGVGRAGPDPGVHEVSRPRGAERRGQQERGDGQSSHAVQVSPHRPH